MKNNNTTIFAALLLAAGMPLVAATPPRNSLPGSQTASQATNDISKKVRHELVMLPFLTIFDNLSYRIDGTTVTLAGQVTRPVVKQDAQRVVKDVEGVSSVQNEIEVLPLSPIDNQIRWAEARSIYGFPTLNRYGAGTQPSIHIVVKNGNVTLVGVVNSKSDKDVAGIRANQVPGVFSVQNELKIVKS
ncbi:MAG TPA: BON domain-containing protein [Bryobacteraceae bacterium]|jgi:hyperosmotically inducible protein|nr:BON domain-containing protein [Bryobacteraceae bacterium]